MMRSMIPNMSTSLRMSLLLKNTYTATGCVSDETDQAQPKEDSHVFEEETAAQEGVQAASKQPDVTDLPASSNPNNGNEGEEAMDLTEETSASSKSNPFLIAHDLLAEKWIVFLSLDLETGGPDCSILKISVVVTNGDGVILDTFNEYVKPPETEVSLPIAVEVSGLHKNHPSI